LKDLRAKVCQASIKRKKKKKRTNLLSTKSMPSTHKTEKEKKEVIFYRKLFCTQQFHRIQPVICTSKPIPAPFWSTDDTKNAQEP
jgi:hypothetical protein